MEIGPKKKLLLPRHRNSRRYIHHQQLLQCPVLRRLQETSMRERETCLNL